MRDTHRSIVRVIVNRPARAITCAVLAVALTAAPVLSPTIAFAVSEETQAELDSANQKVDDSMSAYNDAIAKLETLQAQIDENTAAIEQLEQEIPEKQQAASDAMREMYKYQQGSNQLVGVMVGSSSLSDFITSSTYMSQIQDSNSQTIEELNDMQAELEQKRTELEEQKKQLEEEKQKAADALAAAQQERQQAQAQAETAAELAAAAADTNPGEGTGVSGENPYSNATESGQEANVVVTPGVDWTMSREEFIAEWTGRIDAYLAGSPLAGYGATFAAAAWDYGVDPRCRPPSPASRAARAPTAPTPTTRGAGPLLAAVSAPSAAGKRASPHTCATLRTCTARPLPLPQPSVTARLPGRTGTTRSVRR